MDMSLKEGCRRFILVRIDVVRGGIFVTFFLAVIFIKSLFEVASEDQSSISSSIEISSRILSKGGFQRIREFKTKCFLLIFRSWIYTRYL